MIRTRFLHPKLRGAHASLIALLFVILLAGLLTVTITAPSFAQDTGPRTAYAQTVVGNQDMIDKLAQHPVDASAAASLEVRLFTPNPYDDNPAPSPNGSAVTIVKVNDVDLTTAAGWQKALTLDADEVRNTPGLDAGTERTLVAGADGIVKFEGLSVGLYLVTQAPPANAGEAYRTSSPFLVALPVGNPEATGWHYGVIVNTKPAPIFAPIGIEFAADRCSITDAQVGDLARGNMLPTGTTFSFTDPAQSGVPAMIGMGGMPQQIVSRLQQAPDWLRLEPNGKVYATIAAEQLQNGRYQIPVYVSYPNGKHDTTQIEVIVTGAEHCYPSTPTPTPAPDKPKPRGLPITGGHVAIGLGLILAAGGLAATLIIPPMRRKNQQEN